MVRTSDNGPGWKRGFIIKTPTTQDDQTHSDNSSAVAEFDHFVGLAIKGLKSGSHPPKKFVLIKICLTENPLKMIKSAFLFHLKSSQDI